ncbi:MAG: N-acetyltransferase [Eubacteriaceae bacterium]|nr:N-acetyltransferase [Eubacteriaceae bacterium]
MNYIFEKDKVYLKNEEGKTTAEIDFKNISDDTIEIYRTFVDDSLRGQGVAGDLTNETVKYFENKNIKITATCPYAKKWLEKNR